MCIYISDPFSLLMWLFIICGGSLACVLYVIRSLGEHIQESFH